MGADRSYTSTLALRQAVVVLLALNVVVAVYAVSSDLRELALIERFQAGEDVSDAEADASDDRQAKVGLFQLATVVITGFVFLKWWHRCYSNLPALGADRTQATPGFAVGTWFIPFLNLVRPYEFASEMWRVGEPGQEAAKWRSRKASLLVGAWWTVWIADGLFAWFAGRSYAAAVERSSSLDELHAASQNMMYSDAFGIVSASLAIIFVLRLDTRLAAKREEARLPPLSPGA